LLCGLRGKGDVADNASGGGHVTLLGARPALSPGLGTRFLGTSQEGLNAPSGGVPRLFIFYCRFYCRSNLRALSATEDSVCLPAPCFLFVSPTGGAVTAPA
jgi:hypothetical protein